MRPVALIAALGENRAIGAGGAIPWRLPTDFAFFKKMTLGKPVIMGRKTFESIGKPLPGRTNLVVSRRPGYQPDGVIVINDLVAALHHADAIAAADGADEIMVAGGAEIYRQALPVADRLYLTHVALSPDGDAYFPPFAPGDWVRSGIPGISRGDRDNADFEIRRYDRVKPRR